MVLDYVHDRNELRSLEFKARNKRHDLGFQRTFVFHSERTETASNAMQSNGTSPPRKRRRVNGQDTASGDHRRNVTEQDIANRVRNQLRQIGFKRFGEEHARSFWGKLKAQIVSKQLLREQVDAIDLRSAFHEMSDIEEFEKGDELWIAPHVIGPRYLMYCTIQWMMLVDEHRNLYFHNTFNDFYKGILIKLDEKPIATPTIVDGYLIPSDYFGKMDGRNSNSPLQFWISDVLSHQNNAAAAMLQRFKFFQNVQRRYRERSKFMQRGPISIHSLHFEARRNLNNVLKFIQRKQDCVVYGNREGPLFAVDGFIAIKNSFPCTVHDRARYGDRCVLWKCDFDALLTEFMRWQRSLGPNTG